MSHSYDVIINYMWSIHSCFLWYTNYKNRLKNTRIIAENKVAPFSGHGVHVLRCNCVRYNVQRLGVTPATVLQLVVVLRSTRSRRDWLKYRCRIRITDVLSPRNS